VGGAHSGPNAKVGDALTESYMTKEESVGNKADNPKLETEGHESLRLKGVIKESQRCKKKD